VINTNLVINTTSYPAPFPRYRQNGLTNCYIWPHLLRF